VTSVAFAESRAPHPLAIGWRSASTFADMSDLSVRTVAVNGVDLAVRTSSSFDDGDRPLAICVHGFPDSANTWRHLVADLDDAGFRVAAPNLRGFAPSAVPTDERFQAAASSLDMLRLHDFFGGDDRAVLVGHDWGAPIAYGAAVHDSDRWAKVVGLAVPPGPAFAAALLGDLDQLKRSWYMFFFQHPFADFILAADDQAFIEMLWNDWSPGHDWADDLVHAKAALRSPENLAAALGLYRAALGAGSLDPELAELQAATGMVPPQPLLYLHGSTDEGIGADVAESARSSVGDNVTIEIVDDVGHFLHLEAPAVVDARIVEFLS
jgi:pimeloyl-ACP methyl ester carboxylesterase